MCRILHIDDPERLDYLTALAALANSMLWGDAHLDGPLEQALRRVTGCAA